MQVTCLRLLFAGILSLVLLACNKDDEYRFNFTSSPPPAPLVGRTYTADELSAFMQLAVNDGNGTVRKWTRQQVKVYINDTCPAAVKQEVAIVLNDINVITKAELTLTTTTDSTAADIRIYLTNRERYWQIEPPAQQLMGSTVYGGYCYIAWGSEFAIYRSTAFINYPYVLTFGPNYIRYVVRHELTHALGMLGHVSLPQYTASVMHTQPVFVTSYALIDQRMIGLLYNSALRPGLKGDALNAMLVQL